MTTPSQQPVARDSGSRPARRFGTVTCCSGHMIDRDNRPTPRFPQDKEQAVRAAMAAILKGWGIGQGDLAVSGGARGADILFAELCLSMGAWVRLLIALPDDEFISRSVHLPGTDWDQRYLRLREQCETWHWPRDANVEPTSRATMDRTNHWILKTCREEAAPGHFRTLLVWDEQGAGDGPGGTADFAAEARRLGGKVAIVNPMLIDEDTP